MNAKDRGTPLSATAEWPVLRRLEVYDRALAARMAKRPTTRFLYEFVRFGIKQAWACLFGGAMVALLLLTHLWYPSNAAIARYDFLFLAALALQASLLVLRLETREEAKVIAVYHVVGTAMELFKTSVGSWIYPESAFFRLAGVPLFTGFMYSCIGSYLCRIWELLHFRFVHHPPTPWLVALSVLIYANFFTHHYIVDLRWGLFALSALLFWRTRVEFLVWRTYRSMPLLLGFVLITAFIWMAENVGTYTRTWIYPSQSAAWSPVSLGKFGSWFLLLIISYTLVVMIKPPRGRNE